MDIYIWKVGARRYDFSTWPRPLREEAASSRRRGDLTKQDLAILIDCQGESVRVQKVLGQIYNGSGSSHE